MKNLVLIFALATCNIPLMAQNDSLTQSLNDYSFDLYNSLENEKNVFISPFSTYAALLMAYEGAAGDTKKEFENVFHIDNPDLLQSYPAFSDKLSSHIDEANQLNISNALWVQKSFTIRSSFEDKIKSHYSSELFPVNFGKPKPAASAINQWVNDKTQGLIKDIIAPSDLSKRTRLVIANAIYFEGHWDKEFNKKLTQPDTFYATSEETTIDFMHKKERLKYYENKDFQFISKPYKGKNKSLCIILPKERFGLPEVEKQLDSKLLDKLLSHEMQTEVALSMPKFKMETSYSLEEPLMQLGLHKAFSRDADFSGITPEEALMISQVKHKAYIEIDEVQTKAAAATTITMRATSIGAPPKEFNADHPFVFMIVDNATHAILFIGRYAEPQ